MQEIGWFRKSITLTNAFVPEDVKFKIHSMKLKGDVEVSFDGQDSHIKQVAGDGMQTYDFVGKSKIWFKGTGTCEFCAWDGN